MSAENKITIDEAKHIGDALGIDWHHGAFSIEEFHMGLEVELEHGTKNEQTNVTNDDPIITGKIAWAHLQEFPDYYTRLSIMEHEAREYWANG